MNETMSKILVIGSSNTDLIAKVEAFPAAGETVQGKLFLQAMGGKGANQALAAHRLGGDVSFITCLGDDGYGQATLRYYAEEGMDVSAALVVNGVPSGTALILVNEDGENCIVVTPGANHELSVPYIESIEDKIRSASVVVLQMEIPMETVRRACQFAVAHGTPVLLNVAPAYKIDDELIAMVEWLVVNETEIEKISGKKISDTGIDAIMDVLLDMGAKTVILTMGRNGCRVKNNAFSYYIPAFQVDVVDTTAAGDTFCGSLVAQLSKGADLENALRFATAASALCVTRMGAQPSIPMEAEVIAFLQKDVAVVSNGRPSFPHGSSL